MKEVIFTDNTEASKILNLCNKIVGAYSDYNCYALDDIFEGYEEVGLITAGDAYPLEDAGVDMEELENKLNKIFGTEEGQAFVIWLDIFNPDHIRILSEEELLKIYKGFKED